MKVNRDNLEKAFKAVKANNGAPGADGAIVEVKAYLREELRHLHHELKTRIYERQSVLNRS